MLKSSDDQDAGLGRRATFIILIFLTLVSGISCLVPPLVTVGIIAGVTGVYVIFACSLQNKILLILFSFILYSNLIKYLTGVRYSLLIVDFLILLIFVKVVFQQCVLRQFPVFSPLVEFSLLAFLGVSILELFNPNVPSLLAGLEGLRKTSFYMIGFFIGLELIKEKLQLRKVIVVFTAISIPIIIYGIKQAFIMSAFDKRMAGLNWGEVWTYKIYGWNRPIGIFSGPFHYAMLCIIIILCCLYLFLETRKTRYIIFIPLPIVGTLLSMTRTNLVAMVGSLIFFFFLYLIYSKGIRKRKIFAYSFLFLFLAALIIWFAASRLQPLSTSIASLAHIKRDTRFLNRVKTWEEILKAIPRQPVVAYGMGSAGDTLEKIYNFPVHFTSHNLFLKIVIETGVVGLLFYCAFFVGWFALAYRCLQSRDARFKNLSIFIMSAVSVILINGLVGSAVEAFPINFIVWFFMGALVKISWIEKSGMEQL